MNSNKRLHRRLFASYWFISLLMVCGMPTLAQTPITDVAGLNAMTASGNYIISADIDATGYTPTLGNTAFTGTLTAGTKGDGTFYTISNLGRPLFTTATGATISNIMLKDVEISQAGVVGAIACTADGATRIYNCGILPNDPGYTDTSTVGSTNNYCGSLVGRLNGNARVINCFSYATITGGTTVAGIVGYIGGTGITQANVTTVPMVVNCMFYGEITGGTTKYPVYGGAMIKNETDANSTLGVNPYNYFRKNASFDNAYTAIGNYNRSWPAEEKNLTRFEYYRSILNSNKRLCTYWVTDKAYGSASAPTEADEALIAKWVLDPSIAPYPILKKWGKYPSVINIDTTYRINPTTKAKEVRSSANEWEGKSYGTLTVNINPGSHHTADPVSKTITITDMDTSNNDFCYYKIQLPYYNEVFGNPNGATHAAKYGDNYTDYVVTGWDITAVSGGTAGTFDGSSDHAWKDGYNFADRNCTSKDLYATSGRVFAQGGYYYVPVGVSSITIVAHWGKAVYLANRGYNIDRVKLTIAKSYKLDKAFAPAGTVSNTFQGQTVYDDLQDAIKALDEYLTNNATDNPNKHVCDQAIVLIGNHQVQNGSNKIGYGLDSKWHPHTIMSADFDFDNEPDYCLQLQFRNGYDRPGIQPIRFDFLPVVELGLAVRHDNKAYAIGVFVPQGHFEITETSFMHTTQFEYDGAKDEEYRAYGKSPMIINGGEFESFNVRYKNAARTSYFLLGGNAWIHRFAPGAHPNTGNKPTNELCVVNAIGGEYPEFYLSGIFRPELGTTNTQAPPHCYTNGGKFGIMAGAGYDKVKNGVTFKINHSLIGEFYGGGINGSNPIGGNIDVTIDNSRVRKYCGGPKVGDMTGKTVTTNATNTTFGVYYGGGNGGNSYYRQLQRDGNFATSHIGTWTDQSYNWNGFKPLEVYDDGTDNKGYHAEYEFEVFNESNGVTDEITQRGYINWVQFGITITGNVSNTLTDCTIENNFYGGGNLATVNGTVNSTLTNTTVNGSVFGAGYSAAIPTFQVHDKDNKTFPSIDFAGTITDGYIPYAPTVYEWTNDLDEGRDEAYMKAHPTYQKGGKWYCYTWNSLDNLGAVLNAVSLTVGGTSHIVGNVYGGGDESKVNSNANVILQGSAIVDGSVFGAGKGKDDDYDLARVSGDATVTMTSGQVGRSVYGGGEMATVGLYDTVTAAEAAADAGQAAKYRLVTSQPKLCTGGGATTVTLSGGTVGVADLDPVDTNAHGNVFGGGLGKAGSAYSPFAYVNETTVNISGSAVVRGSVFGGGENGHVLGNTHVNISGGTIGVRLPYRYRAILSDRGVGNPVFAGNVYGGGRGVDHTLLGNHLSETAGRVYGNTNVSISGTAHIRHSVYGGGSLASVGTYKIAEEANVFGGHLHTFDVGTGDATVTISDGRIGPLWDDLLYDEAGHFLATTHDGNADTITDADYALLLGHAGDVSDTIAKNYACLGENEGMVYGSGRGVNFDPEDNNDDHQLYVEMAFTNRTFVTINGGMVVGSVFGGGENGHVKNNTQVNIAGGTIGGIPLHHKGFFLPGHNGVHGLINDHNAGDEELDFNNTGVGKSVFRGNVYGGGRGIDHTDGIATTSESHIFSVSAGRVYGNTEVNVTDGLVLHNVFGGGSIASVGTYHYPLLQEGDEGYDAEHPAPNFFTSPDTVVEGTGDAVVNISGGQVGVMGENEGYVYGGGRGIAGKTDAQVTHLAFVNTATVNISSVADVRASVFGGGMNGHVLDSTLVTVSGGVIGGKTADDYGSYDTVNFHIDSLPASRDILFNGKDYYSGICSVDTLTRTDGTGPHTVFLGNVYGGGRGVDTVTGTNLSLTAGRVYGNTRVVITDGIIYHSVFGGGSIASVGYYELYTAADSAADAVDAVGQYRIKAKQPKRCLSGGTATVLISGGRIGTNGRNNGHVFGSSRGMAGAYYRGLGYVNAAHVHIDGTAEVRGSVFGSGENGHVLDSTCVIISGGHIGNGKRGDKAWLNHYIGNVYGGGRGLDREVQNDAASVSPFAGRVFRKTYVEISGTAQIDHNVYGGGSLASVGKYKRDMDPGHTSTYNSITFAAPDSGMTHVVISGGTIGIDGDENGHVFGSSRGTSSSRHDIRSSLAYVADTRIDVSGNARIYGSVFGGGESGHVQNDAIVNISGSPTIGLDVSSILPTIDAGSHASVSSLIDAINANGELDADEKADAIAAVKDSAKSLYDLNGNIYGGGRGIDPYKDNLGNDVYSYSAGYVRGRTFVTVGGTPTIYRNVYGGGSMGIVGDYGPYGEEDLWQSTGDNGTATVRIKNTGGTVSIGTAANSAVGYGGHVYGSSRGQANDPANPPITADGFGEMAYVFKTHVVVDSGALVYGSVYGGGENGHVDYGGTTVDILGGTVGYAANVSRGYGGNVFGGGKGNPTSPTAGIVDGPTQVNIGSSEQTANNVIIRGDVFAGNDSYSSPLGEMRVDVYHTGHDANNSYPYPVPETMDELEAQPHAAANFALHGVYGGGNLASVLTGIAATDASDGNASHVYDKKYITQRLLPTENSNPAWPGDTTRKSVVHIHNCDNTIMYIYGGGRAADTRLNEVIVDGGYIYKAFAGGNGDPNEVPGNPGANVLRTASLTINGGLIVQAFGGSNTLGDIYGGTSVVMEKVSACDELIGESFGAGNAADFVGDIDITVGCGTILENLYGGANEADITGNVTLTVEGGTYTNVFGGSKGTLGTPANITGDVTLNITGGTIQNAFGGSHINGHIGGKITVNVYCDPNNVCTDEHRLINVYGGGKDASYTPTAPSATGSNHSPMVNIQCDTVWGDVFGGAYGSGATCTSKPKVVMGLVDGTVSKAVVMGNIYGGGSAAPVIGNTTVLMQSGTVMGDIFGGGLGTTATVSTDTEVGIVGNRTQVQGNVYGGGNAGAVGGSTEVYIGEKPE